MLRRYTCESVLRNRRITRLPETIIRGCRNYEQYLSFQPRNYLPMCVRLQRITENSKYCAISSRAHEFFESRSRRGKGSRRFVAFRIRLRHCVANSLRSFVDSLIPFGRDAAPHRTAVSRFRAPAVQCALKCIARTSR